jgi:hypothetical protein
MLFVGVSHTETFPLFGASILSCAKNIGSFQLPMEHSALAEQLQMETK